MKKIKNTDQRKKWIFSQLKIVEDNFMDGINIDFEDAIPHDRPDLKQALTDLVNETTKAFKSVHPNYQVNCYMTICGKPQSKLVLVILCYPPNMQS